MSELDQVITAAYDSGGAQDKVNKVYVTLFRKILYIPVHKNNNKDDTFMPLYMQMNKNYFMLVFDSLTRLQTWAANESKNVDYAEMLGADVLRYIGDDIVYLCLNVGTNFYKEFSPEEIAYLKKMLGKIAALKK